MLIHRRFGALLLLIINNGIIASAQEDYNDYQGGGDNYQSRDDYQGGDDYQDYAYEGSAEDNLYNDVVQRQEGVGGGGIGIIKVGFLILGSYVAGGKIHSNRAVKKVKEKFHKEQKALYTQYYNDVYKLTNQNAEISELVGELREDLKTTKDKAEIDAIQRDYEEFKQPDIDGDDRISSAEFNMYVKNYLSNYPGLEEKDYPTFEDFDHDGDGYVGFKEYAQQMALQVQQAEADQFLENQNKEKKVDKLGDLLGGGKGDSFEDIYGQYLR